MCQPPTPRFRTARRVRAAPLLLWLAAATAACAPAPDSGSRLVVERSNEGNVTTVRNVSGSGWGGSAHLAEELSIGVAEGAEHEMFGQVRALWATEDRLYVVDSQAPALRTYDRAGSHLGDIGRPGQGPGEYQGPADLVVRRDGSLVVRDNRNRRLVYFDADGQPIGTWRAESGFVFGLNLLHDDTVIVYHADPPADAARTPIFTAVGAAATLSDRGVLGAPRAPPTFGFVAEPFVLQAGDRITMSSGAFLFRPYHYWTSSPNGALVAGVSDRYRFEIHAADGTITAVERAWEPVPVHPDEAAYAVKELEGTFRRLDPDWIYQGDPPASTKPAYQSIHVDRDDRIWLTRHGEGRRVQDCVEDPRADPAGARQRPCWVPPTIVDAFAADGSYLGELVRPEGLTFRTLFIRDGEYWAAVEDDDGLVTVRRFRIVTPEDT